mmetsp:Transcript_19030/g.53980  ORF Transcript_19030/g.53980 Transcript_19030/m.53980 type:complete len:237 (+) Transcript_19030:46-756(+)
MQRVISCNRGVEIVSQNASARNIHSSICSADLCSDRAAVATHLAQRRQLSDSARIWRSLGLLVERGSDLRDIEFLPQRRFLWQEAGDADNARHPHDVGSLSPEARPERRHAAIHLVEGQIVAVHEDEVDAAIAVDGGEHFLHGGHSLAPCAAVDGQKKAEVSQVFRTGLKDEYASVNGPPKDLWAIKVETWRVCWVRPKDPQAQPDVAREAQSVCCRCAECARPCSVARALKKRSP